MAILQQQALAKVMLVALQCLTLQLTPTAAVVAELVLPVQMQRLDRLVLVALEAQIQLQGLQLPTQAAAEAAAMLVPTVELEAAVMAAGPIMGLLI